MLNQNRKVTLLNHRKNPKNYIGHCDSTNIMLINFLLPSLDIPLINPFGSVVFFHFKLCVRFYLLVLLQCTINKIKLDKFIIFSFFQKISESNYTICNDDKQKNVCLTDKYDSLYNYKRKQYKNCLLNTNVLCAFHKHGIGNVTKKEKCRGLGTENEQNFYV